MADNVPYKYKPSDNALTEKEISAAIEFQTSKNNVYEKKEEPKTKVFNPFSILLLDPTLGPQTWIKKFKYNKKISDGKLDEVTDEERLLFESKVDTKQPFLKRIYSPKTYLQRDIEKETDIVSDLATGAVTGVPLGVKAVGELLTTGVDYTFDTDFTTKLDEVTEEFLNFTGEPETLAGQITQFGTQFAVPFKVVDKLIRNIGKLKPYINKIPGMNKLGVTGTKLVNKNRFIKSGANIAQRMGTGALALGATDFVASGKERIDPMFLESTN